MHGPMNVKKTGFFIPICDVSNEIEPSPSPKRTSVSSVSHRITNEGNSAQISVLSQDLYCGICEPQLSCNCSPDKPVPMRCAAAEAKL
jgi:hypothetical protein